MWTWLNYTIYIIICVFSGSATAAGFVAFISLLGVFPALSEKYKIIKDYWIIEIALILGVTFGNILYLYNFSMPFGYVGLIITTLFGGIFVGCLAGAIAEVLNVFPIISRRFKIRKHLPYILIAVACGKAVGSLIQYFVF